MLERVVRIHSKRRPPRGSRLLDLPEIALARCQQHVGGVASRIVGNAFPKAGYRPVVVAQCEVRLGNERRERRRCGTGGRVWTRILWLVDNGTGSLTSPMRFAALRVRSDLHVHSRMSPRAHRRYRDHPWIGKGRFEPVPQMSFRRSETSPSL